MYFKRDKGFSFQQKKYQQTRYKTEVRLDGERERSSVILFNPISKWLARSLCFIEGRSLKLSHNFAVLFNVLDYASVVNDACKKNVTHAGARARALAYTTYVDSWYIEPSRILKAKCAALRFSRTGKSCCSK